MGRQGQVCAKTVLTLLHSNFTTQDSDSTAAADTASANIGEENSQESQVFVSISLTVN